MSRAQHFDLQVEHGSALDTQGRAVFVNFLISICFLILASSVDALAATDRRRWADCDLSNIEIR